MATTTRLYVVTGQDKSRLVEAASQSAAMAHVAKSTFSVRIAAAKEVAGLIAGGATVEKAGTAEA